MNILSRLVPILFMSRRDSSILHGKIILELVLAGPILLMIPAAVIEYARFIRFSQEAIVLSQEAANRVYRQCTDFYEVRQEATGVVFLNQETIDATRRCVQNIRDELNPIVLNRLGNSALILSVFRYNIENGTPATALRRVALVPTPTDPLDTTIVETTVVTGSTITSNTVNDTSTPQKGLISAARATTFQRFAIAEVSFNYTPVIGLFRAFFNLNTFTKAGGFREITVL